jgi:hypothetical protein
VRSCGRALISRDDKLLACYTWGSLSTLNCVLSQPKARISSDRSKTGNDFFKALSARVIGKFLQHELRERSSKMGHGYLKYVVICGMRQRIVHAIIRM